MDEARLSLLEERVIKLEGKVEGYQEVYAYLIKQIHDVCSEDQSREIQRRMFNFILCNFGIPE